MEKGSVRQAATVKINLGNFQNIDVTSDTTIHVESETREGLLSALEVARGQALNDCVESLNQQKKVLEDVGLSLTHTHDEIKELERRTR